MVIDLGWGGEGHRGENIKLDSKLPPSLQREGEKKRTRRAAVVMGESYMYQRLAYNRGEEVGEEEEEEERDRRRGDVMVKCDVMVGCNSFLCVSTGVFVGVCLHVWCGSFMCLY